MNKTFQTIGIVLNKKDWREADSLFTIYTADYGKLDLVAVGCRKIKSKLMGHLSSYGLVDVMVAKSKRIDKLATARLVEKFNFDIETDFYYFNFLFEVLDKAVGIGQKDLALWQLLLNCIKWFSGTKNKAEKNIVMAYFVIQLIKEIGYTPELRKCGKCGVDMEKVQFFSLLDNGVICNSCIGEKISLPSEMIRMFQYLLSNNLDDFTKQSWKNSTIEKLIFFIKQWSEFVLEKPINTFKFI